MMNRRWIAALLVTALCLAFPAQAGEAIRLYDRAANGMAMVDDTLYLADGWSRGIFRAEEDGLTLVTGRQSPVDPSGRPTGGYNDEDLKRSAFSEPWGMIPWQEGLLVADAGNHAIRFVDVKEDKVYTAVGTGKAGFSDGKGRRAAFDRPTGLAVDEDGLVYIADTGNHAIRTMDEKGRVKTLLGGTEGSALGSLRQTRLSAPTGLCWNEGVLYIADTGNHRILAVADGQVTLVAGAVLTGEAAIEGRYLNGPAEAARFSSPQGLAVASDGTVYVADTGNGAVRVIRAGYVTTLLRSADAATWPVAPTGLLTDGDSLLVGDGFSRVVLQVDTAVAETVFSDVAKEAYYAEAVDFALANGLMNGTSPTTFSPNGATTRAMIWTILARQDGMDTTGSVWYEKGRAWAMAAGISDGANPNSPITREQLATMLWRYARYKGVDVSIGESTNILSWPDAFDVSEYAIPAMQWATGAGIINGKNGKLVPGGSASRAEAATMLMRFLVNN